MKRIPTRLTRIPFLLLTLASILWAQAEPQTPKPSPEHQRLHYFVGSWQIEWETMPGPMGPGGKASVTDHNEMLGAFLLSSTAKDEVPRDLEKRLVSWDMTPSRRSTTTRFSAMTEMSVEPPLPSQEILGFCWRPPLTLADRKETSSRNASLSRKSHPRPIHSSTRSRPTVAPGPRLNKAKQQKSEAISLDPRYSPGFLSSSAFG